MFLWSQRTWICWKSGFRSRVKSIPTKIQAVLDFPLPTVGKQLKSFLGTVNYLRDFVRNHSTIVKPLHDLIANYDKHRKIVWTPETIAAFNEMKLQISRCSTKHFMSDTAHWWIWLWCWWTFAPNSWRNRSTCRICKQICKQVTTTLVCYTERSLWNILFLYVLTVTPA